METKTDNSSLSQEQKLKEIIAKVVKRGYEWDNYHATGRAGQEGFAAYAILSGDYPKLIFAHDFAKAFFGEKPETLPYPGFIDDMPTSFDDLISGYEDDWTIPAWHYHLQKLAITPPEERIDYLYNFVNE